MAVALSLARRSVFLMVALVAFTGGRTAFGDCDVSSVKPPPEPSACPSAKGGKCSSDCQQAANDLSKTGEAIANADSRCTAVGGTAAATAADAGSKSTGAAAGLADSSQLSANSATQNAATNLQTQSTIMCDLATRIQKDKKKLDAACESDNPPWLKGLDDDLQKRINAAQSACATKANEAKATQNLANKTLDNNGKANSFPTLKDMAFPNVPPFAGAKGDSPAWPSPQQDSAVSPISGDPGTSPAALSPPSASDPAMAASPPTDASPTVTTSPPSGTPTRRESDVTAPSQLPPSSPTKSADSAPPERQAARDKADILGLSGKDVTLDMLANPGASSVSPGVAAPKAEATSGTGKTEPGPVAEGGGKLSAFAGRDGDRALADNTPDAANAPNSGAPPESSKADAGKKPPDNSSQSTGPKPPGEKPMEGMNKKEAEENRTSKEAETKALTGAIDKFAEKGLAKQLGEGSKALTEALAKQGEGALADLVRKYGADKVTDAIAKLAVKGPIDAAKSVLKDVIKDYGYKLAARAAAPLTGLTLQTIGWLAERIGVRAMVMSIPIVLALAAAVVTAPAWATALGIGAILAAAFEVFMMLISMTSGAQ